MSIAISGKLTNSVELFLILFKLFTMGFTHKQSAKPDVRSTQQKEDNLPTREQMVHPDRRVAEMTAMVEAALEKGQSKDDSFEQETDETAARAVIPRATTS